MQAPDLGAFPPSVQYILAALGVVLGVSAWVFGYLKKGTPAPATGVIAPQGVMFNVQILQEAIDALKADMRNNEERERMTRAVASNVIRVLEVLESTNRLTRELVEVQVRLERRYQEDLQRRTDADRLHREP